MIGLEMPRLEDEEADESATARPTMPRVWAETQPSVAAVTMA